MSCSDHLSLEKRTFNFLDSENILNIKVKERDRISILYQYMPLSLHNYAVIVLESIS